jgi:hypothetical protein
MFLQLDKQHLGIPTMAFMLPYSTELNVVDKFQQEFQIPDLMKICSPGWSCF